MLRSSSRRRSPAIRSRRIKPPHPSPSPSPSSRRRSKNKSRPDFKILKRCSSAPLLLSRGRDDFFEYELKSEGSLFRPQTFSEAFVSSPSLFASSPILVPNKIDHQILVCYVIITIIIVDNYIDFSYIRGMRRKLRWWLM
ncbi:hypothetical protein Ahy_B05g079090 [Arachis hypogaea]|uniref:Uncharacterized protein n=1 Tax=Arachis hypogaea TaxID=3818 RepID=A0A444Z8Y6_ARAHY|nr:hypothetical protein Ahy_B05g079090 [Arachis hypogaea]